MNILKRIWPYSFKEKKDIVALLIDIVLHIVAAIVIGFVIGILTQIPIVNIIVGLFGGLLELYFFIGIVLSILDYFEILR